MLFLEPRSVLAAVCAGNFPDQSVLVAEHGHMAKAPTAEVAMVWALAKRQDIVFTPMNQQ